MKDEHTPLVELIDEYFESEQAGLQRLIDIINNTKEESNNE